MAKSKRTFIDLFAGIGGTRIAFEEAGCSCVFSSEWDKFAQITYEANFGEKPVGDIRKIRVEEIPDHDILVAGFPCQPFSISGVSKLKSLKKQHGFKNEEQGNLFWEIARIIEGKKPEAFLLENVKNLRSHDKGKTYKIITETLKELGYHIFDEILDAINYVPQHRERIFIVGFKNKKNFSFPSPPRKRPVLKDILEKETPEKYILSDHLWNYLQEYAKRQKARGNGFGYGLADTDSHSRTLSARYYKDGSEILIPRGKNKNPRRLTPKECMKLMGFDQLRPNFEIPVSDTQAYRQFGNSVVVPLVNAIAKEIVDNLACGKDNYRGSKTPEEKTKISLFG